jgi:predicted outer membrane repeat protein
MIGAINLLSLDAKTTVKNSEATGGSGGAIYVSGSLTSGVQTLNIVGTIIENSFAKTGTGGVAKIIGRNALVNVITAS